MSVRDVAFVGRCHIDHRSGIWQELGELSVLGASVLQTLSRLRRIDCQRSLNPVQSGEIPAESDYIWRRVRKRRRSRHRLRNKNNETESGHIWRRSFPSYFCAQGAFRIIRFFTLIPFGTKPITPRRHISTSSRAQKWSRRLQDDRHRAYRPPSLVRGRFGIVR